MDRLCSWPGNEQFEPPPSQEISFTVEKSTFEITTILLNPLYLTILIVAIGVIVAASLSRRREGEVTAPRVSARHCSHCGAVLQPDDE